MLLGRGRALNQGADAGGIELGGMLAESIGPEAGPDVLGIGIGGGGGGAGIGAGAGVVVVVSGTGVGAGVSSRLLQAADSTERVRIAAKEYALELSMERVSLWKPAEHAASASRASGVPD